MTNDIFTANLGVKEEREEEKKKWTPFYKMHKSSSEAGKRKWRCIISPEQSSVSKTDQRLLRMRIRTADIGYDWNFLRRRGGGKGKATRG